MTDNETRDATLQPSAAMLALSRLIGTWTISGGATGEITYEWMDGGFFLLQRVNLNDNQGLEIIGHEHVFGAEPSIEIKSRFYGNKGTRSTTSTSSTAIR